MKKSLRDLPSFTIARIEQDSNELKLHGQFDHLETIRGLPRRSWLYNPPNSIVGDLTALDRDSRNAVFVAHVSDGQFLAGGNRAFPWLDGYWNAALIERIVNQKTGWSLVKFEPQDAVKFVLDKVNGWSKAGQKIPEGAQPAGIIPNGWDHEHCGLCQQKIGVGGAETGYVDPSDSWLCCECYEKFGRDGDLSFLFEGP